MSFLSETKICDLKETPTRLSYLSDHRGTPRKIRWGCAACFLKPLLYLGPKCLIFPSQFVTQPKIQNLVNFMTWLLNQNSVSALPFNQFPSSDQC